MHFYWDNSEDKDKKEQIDNVKVFMKLVPYFKKHIKTLSLAFTLLCISTAASLSLPLILKKIIDSDLPTKNFDGILISGLIYMGLYFIYVCGDFVQTIILSRMGLKIIQQMKEKLFRHILTQSLSFFEEYTPGKLLSRIESDAESMKQLFSNISINIFRNIFTFIGILAILFVSDPEITSWVALIIPFLFFCTFFFIRYIRKLYQKVRKVYAELTGILTEYIQSVQVIQIFNISDLIKKKLDATNDRRFKTDRNANIANYTFWGFFSFVEISAIAIIISIGGYKVFDGSMTIGSFIMFIEFTRRIFSPIMEFSEYINMIQKAFVSANRIFNILETKPTIKDNQSKRRVPTLSKSISFDNVTFQYNDKTTVLENLSFDVKKNQTVAIVGPSGVGKTTICNLCMRFIEQESGEILFDGIDIREFSHNNWRQKIGLVLQDIYLFPGTIRDNIQAMSKGVSEERVKEAAKIVRASKFIERLPEGYESSVFERGNNLSFGERQLISFSRALAINPEILLLDEATSSIDPYTERMIQKATQEMLKGRTSLVIAHRLSTIKNADLILVMGKEGIIEEGDHEFLLNKNGAYKEMYNTQLGAEQENSKI